MWRVNLFGRHSLLWAVVCFLAAFKSFAGGSVPAQAPPTPISAPPPPPCTNNSVDCLQSLLSNIPAVVAYDGSSLVYSTENKFADWNTPLPPWPQMAARPLVSAGPRATRSTKPGARFMVPHIRRPRTTRAPAEPRPKTVRPASAGGVQVALSPSLIDNDYYGDVGLNITGLTNGETVLVQKFQVFNDTGTLDASAQLVQSLTLRDGQNAIVGGITNFLAAADQTGVDGSINARLSFLDRFSSQIVGQYVYQVSSPGNRFAPVPALFSVKEHVYAQGFAGTVRDNGQPVANACVVLLDTASGFPDFVAGTVTDATGTYHLSSVPGTYQMVAFKQGYVGNVDTAGQPVLEANANLTVDLELNPADLLIAGRLSDAANSGLGLAGVQVLLTSDSDDLIAGYTDGSGNFSIGATADFWHLTVSSRLINQVGYVPFANPIDLDTTGGDVSGVSLPLPRVNALIYGTVRTPDNAPVAEVDLAAVSADGSYGGFGSSDPNGNYVVAINASTNFPAWFVGAVDGSTSDQVFLPADWVAVYPSTGQPIASDILIYPATGNLAGRVADQSGAPVPWVPLELEAAAPMGPHVFAYGQTDEQGQFTVPVLASTWNVRLDAYESFLLGAGNYAGTEALGISVVDAGSVTNVSLIMQKASRNLLVTLRDSQTNKVSGIEMAANQTLNGTTFSARGVDLGDATTAIPVFDGAWSLELSSPYLTFHGYASPVVENVNVPAGGTNDVPVSINLLPAPLSLFPLGVRVKARTFGILLAGVPGQTASLESSGDLVTWQPVVSVTFTSGNMLYQDFTGTNGTRRFYRMVKPP